MKENTEINTEESKILTDLKYICKSASLITESLQRGCDVAQLPNGDLIVTEIKTVNTQYTWDDAKGRMVRSSQI
jgi:hypothetical protein